MNPTILDSAFQHPADGWYQIEAHGEHPHQAAGVVQVIDAHAAQTIAQRFNADAAAGQLRHGHELLIDHEHFSDQPDQETRAYGWLQELQPRADGLYGRIRWTSTGQAAVDGGDYRFFSTEYDAADLSPVVRAKTNLKKEDCAPSVRPLRLAGLTLTNMNNNRGQKPITNRAGLNVTGNSTTLHGTHPQTFAGTPSPAHPNPMNQGNSMKSVCTLLGLSADTEETTVHAAVTKLLNRGEIAPGALAALRAEHQSFAEQNQTLLAEQAETLLDGCGVKDERIRNRLRDGLKSLKNRAERLSYLADFGYQPGEPIRSQPATRVLNRGSAPVRATIASALGDGEQVVALKIQNRAGELQSKGMKYDSAWNQARREILNKN